MVGAGRRSALRRGGGVTRAGAALACLGAFGGAGCTLWVLWTLALTVGPSRSPQLRQAPHPAHETWGVDRVTDLFERHCANPTREREAVDTSEVDKSLTQKNALSYYTKVSKDTEKPLHVQDGYWLFSTAEWNEYILALLRPLQITRGDLVLEGGCGAGAALDVLQRHSFGVYTFGIDFVGKLIETARRSVAGSFCTANIQHLEWIPSGIFDKVFANGVLMYMDRVEDVVASVKELVRVLKPGGGLMLATFNDPDIPEEARQGCKCDGSWLINPAWWYRHADSLGLDPRYLRVIGATQIYQRFDGKYDAWSRYRYHVLAKRKFSHPIDSHEK